MGAALDGFFEHLIQGFNVIRMDPLKEVLVAGMGGGGIGAEEAVDLLRPLSLVTGDMHDPAANAADLLCHLQPCCEHALLGLILPQLGQRLLAAGRRKLLCLLALTQVLHITPHLNLLHDLPAVHAQGAHLKFAQLPWDKVEYAERPQHRALG